jgi:hypothetical protein
VETVLSTLISGKIGSSFSATNGWQGFRPMRERPINDVLIAMGIQAENFDEFAALGLMKYHHMEDRFEVFTEFSSNDCYPE